MWRHTNVIHSRSTPFELLHGPQLMHRLQNVFLYKSCSCGTGTKFCKLEARRCRQIVTGRATFELVPARAGRNSRLGAGVVMARLLPGLVGHVREPSIDRTRYSHCEGSRLHLRPQAHGTIGSLGNHAWFSEPEGICWGRKGNDDECCFVCTLFCLPEWTQSEYLEKVAVFLRWTTHVVSLVR